MNKKIISAIAITVATMTLAGCSGSSNPGLSGAFWNENPTGNTITPIYEKLEYDVEFTHKNLYSSVEIKSNDIDFTIDKTKSSYVVELYSSEDNSYYTLKTSLTIYGAYTYADGKTYAVDEDITTTETTFKSFKDELRPIKSIRKQRNVVPTNIAPTSEDNFVVVGYESVISYGEGNTANVKITPDAGSENSFTNKKLELDYPKYNKKEYIDTEMMIFFFRGFDFSGSFSYSFTTIDALSEKVANISASSLTDSSGNSVSETPISVSGYWENGVNPSGEKVFNTYGIKFSTTGSYSQNFLFAYYAVNSKDDAGNDKDNNNRHRPIKIFRSGIYNTGYIEYTMRKVSTTK